jgi:hypothetical protein
VGDIELQATVSGVDQNNNDARSDSGVDTVTVEAPAGLRIVSTVSKAYNIQGGVSYVNNDQNFDVHVDVSNTGTSVYNAGVSLISNQTAVVTADSIRSIGAGETSTYIFNVLAASGSETIHTFTAQIDSARSSNTDQLVTPSPPADNTESVLAQTPADITIDFFEITWPAQSTDNTVSTGQLFDVTARVRNTGYASLDSTITVAMTLPSDFEFDAGQDSVKVFTLPSDTRIDVQTWRLRAPSLAGTSPLKARLKSIPNDANTGSSLKVTIGKVDFDVTVFETDFDFDTPHIVSPAGAVDRTVSTGQTFTIESRLTAEQSVSAIEAIIQLPPTLGFQTIGASTLVLGDGPFTDRTVAFTVQAPANAAPPVVGDFTIDFSGVDNNTSLPIDTSSAVLTVTAIEKARLALAAWIADPPEAASDNTVTVNSEFTLRCRVKKYGVAAIDQLPQGTVTLVALPQGYSLTSGNQTQPFTINGWRDWVIRAPGQPSGPDAFTIRIANIPDDENTNAPAVVDTIEQTIPIVTEGANIAMSDVSGAVGIGNKVVPGGSKNVDKFAFSLDYRANDPNANTAVVEMLRVMILDKNGNSLSDNALAATLSGLHVRVNGDTANAFNPRANPVEIDLSNANSAAIDPDSSVTLTVGLSLKNNPAAQEIRLAFVDSSISVVDSVSRQSLPIVDAETGQPIDGRFRSTPLVILSSNFQEYAHNYPNPFRAGDPSQPTNITYFLNQPGNVEIKVYALTGDLVFKKSYAAGGQHATAGPQEVQWDGRNEKGEVVRNGVYVCVITAGSNSAKFRIAVAK